MANVQYKQHCLKPDKTSQVLVPQKRHLACSAKPRHPPKLPASSAAVLVATNETG